MVGYGNVYALINQFDRTGISLIRSVAVCLLDANTTFELPSQLKDERRGHSLTVNSGVLTFRCFLHTVKQQGATFEK